MQLMQQKHCAHPPDAPCPAAGASPQRIDKCAAAGYPAVVVDYLSDTGDSANGLSLTLAHYQEYLAWLADTSHAKGMYIGAMNGGNVVYDLNIVNKLDFAVASGCVASGCGSYGFFAAGGLCAREGGEGRRSIVAGVQKAVASHPACMFHPACPSCVDRLSMELALPLMGSRLRVLVNLSTAKSVPGTGHSSHLLGSMAHTGCVIIHCRKFHSHPAAHTLGTRCPR